MTHPRRFTLVLPAALALASLLAWAIEWAGRPSPTLEVVARLAASGDFDAAEAALGSILKAYPNLDDAHLLAAQLRLDRPEPPTEVGQRPDPAPARVALEHLARVDPGEARRDALVDLYRGKAEYRLAEFDKAHSDWLAALRLDPLVPEAGWCLLDLYYLEGRSAESRALALRLHEVEIDPRVRVQFLLELLRQDAQPMAPESLAEWFEPVARQAPDDLHVALTLGLALARTEHPEHGLDQLAQLVHDHPTEADAWGAWLTGLNDAGEVKRLEQAYTALPSTLATTPRFARHKARLALERGDFQGAVVAYRRALLVSPGDQTIESRLARSLRLAGDMAGAESIERHRQAYLAAVDEVSPLYDEASAIADLGTVAHPDLYRRIADLRERLGHPDEARAWNRLILHDQPNDLASRAAIERLGE